MNTEALVEWQIRDSDGTIMPWLTHSFLEVLKTWDLSDKICLETGAGRSTAYWRKHCKWVDTIEANPEWAMQASKDCDGYQNGNIFYKEIPDGVPERMPEYFDLIPSDTYDLIVVDGIYRTEMMQWAVDHLKAHGGIVIADNWQQDFVWISPKAEEIMAPYKINRFVQKNHSNHEGRPWNTCYWEIPKI